MRALEQPTITAAEEQQYEINIDSTAGFVIHGQVEGLSEGGACEEEEKEKEEGEEVPPLQSSVTTSDPLPDL